MDWAVRPGIGLGELLFGVSRDVVRGHLGEPDEVDEDYLCPCPEVRWHYEDLGLTASFDGEEGFRLWSLRVTSEEAGLFGHRLIGCPEGRVRSVLGRMGLGPVEEELLEFSDHPSLGWLRYPDRGLDFWFQEGRLDSIQWNPLIGSGDEFLWPRGVDRPG
jgi:hypothetical protein